MCSGSEQILCDEGSGESPVHTLESQYWERTSWENKSPVHLKCPVKLMSWHTVSVPFDDIMIKWVEVIHAHTQTQFAMCEHSVLKNVNLIIPATGTPRLPRVCLGSRGTCIGTLLLLLFLQLLPIVSLTLQKTLQKMCCNDHRDLSGFVTTQTFVGPEERRFLMLFHESAWQLSHHSNLEWLSSPL